MYENKNKGGLSKINKLRYIREKRRLSAEEVANYLKISVSFYYNLERGIRTLTDEYLIKLSEYYSVTTDFLLGRPTPLPDIDMDFVEIVKEAENSGVSKEEVKEIIEYYKFKKGIK